MRFLVRVFREGNDYSAMVPSLPGCVAAGGSVPELRKLITKAIWLHVDLMRRSGQEMPPSDVDENDQPEAGELRMWIELKHRIYLIARDLNKNPQDVLHLCQRLGIDARNQVSSVSDEERHTIEAYLRNL